MGICKSTHPAPRAPSLDMLDEAQPLFFDVVISNLQGRNFKKVG